MDIISFFILLAGFMVPMIWGGYLAFMRYPIVAVLLFLFYWPALWFWGLAECIINLLETFAARNRAS
jgi:hypothetical protein